MDDYYSQVIDYRSFIHEQARSFWGRTHLFRELSTWLTGEGPRFFAIIGGPGSGKTAIAARLAQIAMGTEPSPESSLIFKKDYLSALHFCSAFDLRWTGDRRWYHPHVFAESISCQLAVRYPEFGKALLEKSSNRQITLNTAQRVDNNTGKVIGIYIKNLDVSRLTPEDAFSYVVREPLEALARQRPNERFVLLIDALDESLRYSGPVNILRLITETSTLSSQIRFIVSARPGNDDLEQLAELPTPQMYIYRLDQEPGLSHSLQDIHDYVLARTAQPELSKRLARGLTHEELATAVRDRSAGNFLYVDQLLQMLASSRRIINRSALDALPDGLSKFYRAFLGRVLEPTNRSWEDCYQPVLGTLAVEREALNRQQLADIVDTGKGKIVPVLASVRQLLEVDDNLPASRRSYTFYHRSLADFLLDEDAAEEYWCEEAEQHERITNHYLPQINDDTGDSQDHYGLRNLAFHLAEAAQGRSGVARHHHVETLVDLLCNPTFEQRYQTDCGNPVGWRDDLTRSLRVTSRDKHGQTPALLIKIAAAYLLFHQKYQTPKAIFDLVRQGELHAAEQRLNLFSIDNKWHQAALLAISWVAAEKDGRPEYAEAIFKRVAGNPTHPAPLPFLMVRVASALFNDPLPEFSLPPAPPKEVALGLVKQMGGMTSLSGEADMTELLRSFTAEPLNLQAEVLIAASEGCEGDESIYAATREAPLLVSYADQQARLNIEVDQEHDYIGNYIRIHAANNYIRYRNGSLWVILDSILQHHDQTWVRDRVIDLVTIALAGSRLEYTKNLHLAVLAWQADKNIPGASSELQRSLVQAQQGVAALVAVRGRNDISGRVTRLLAGMAEVQSFVLGQTDVARELIQKVLNPEVFGFAGLYAPAALTLAEAIRISLPGDRNLIDQALYKAQSSAHRIQDGRFCAQTTARWNALKRRWWDVSCTAPELEETIRAFAADPGEARFAALHHRGENYDLRPKNHPGLFPIPPKVQSASTLAQLADVYERPLAELERINPDNEDSHEWVNVSDPEFAPLLAARLAAETLVIDGLSAAKRVELIQLLIPPAVSNPTVLDTILARLVLAAQRVSALTLDQLVETVGVMWPEEGVGRKVSVMRY